MPEDAPKRVLLKLSGEALMGDLPYGIDSAMLNTIAGQLKHNKISVDEVAPIAEIYSVILWNSTGNRFLTNLLETVTDPTQRAGLCKLFQSEQMFKKLSHDTIGVVTRICLN